MKLILFENFVIRSINAFASYSPILPKSDEKISFYFQFEFPVQLEMGDLLFISFLSFQYNAADYIKLEKSIKSNINFYSFAHLHIYTSAHQNAFASSCSNRTSSATLSAAISFTPAFAGGNS